MDLIVVEQMKVISLFSCIGAFEKALTNLKIDYKIVAFSEIDKYAIKSYCAIHNIPENKNLGDIAKILKKIIIALLIALTFITCLSNYCYELKQKEMMNYINKLEKEIEQNVN